MVILHVNNVCNLAWIATYECVLSLDEDEKSATLMNSSFFQQFDASLVQCFLINILTPAWIYNIMNYE